MHLVETARSLRLHASLPTRYWGVCILTATYIINLLPSAVLGCETPFTKLHGKPPPYKQLRVNSDVPSTVVPSPPGCKPPPFPMSKGLNLSIDQGEVMGDLEPYRRLVGLLLYLNMTRPDISYAFKHSSQFMAQPRDPYYKTAIHLVKYLKGTMDLGLFFPTANFCSLTWFCDADWGTCLYSGRSLSGFCTFFGHSLVSWKTKK
ncbi:hypothetical protein V2J09_018778 [Rumex salicifolius]